MTKLDKLDAALSALQAQDGGQGPATGDARALRYARAAASIYDVPLRACFAALRGKSDAGQGVMFGRWRHETFGAREDSMRAMRALSGQPRVSVLAP